MPQIRSSELKFKSFLAIEQMSKSELRAVFDTASVLAQGTGVATQLRDKTVALCFFENSTRTQLSFEVAAKRLGARVITLSKDSSSVRKGESLYDTGRTLEAIGADVLILRHGSSGAAHQLAQIVQIPVVNAGDGMHEHPTQALCDVMTIEEHKKSLVGLRILIVGDIAHSRVARSDIHAFKTLGAEVTLCGPTAYVPERAAELGVDVCRELDSAVCDKDVIVLLRVQKERFAADGMPSLGEYVRAYRFDDQMLRRCKPDVLVMHPGPVNRGVELSPEVADGGRCVMLEQVANGVSVRMAVLHLVLGGRVLRREGAAG